MLNLPLVPFELVLFAVLLSFTAGMVSCLALFLFASRIKRSYSCERELPWWTLDDHG